MFNVWNGTAWVTIDKPLVWDGTAWTHRGLSYWDGLEWQNQALVGMNSTTSVTTSWDVAAPTVPPAPPTQTYTVTKSVAASWSATYRADGSKRTDESDIYQGYNSSYQGNQKSLIYFNLGSIPAGATCVSATLYLYANHWYNNSGGTAVIGTHNKTSEPSSWSATGTNSDRLRYAWNTKTGGRNISLGTTIGNEFLSGSTKGIMIGPGASTSSTYYGYFEDAGSYKPTLTIKYTYTA